MEFHKNKLINKTIDEFVLTWKHTLDTEDFVDKKFLKRIDKYIFRNLKKKFNEIDVYHLLYLRDKGVKLGLFDKIKIWFSGLETIYNVETSKRKKKKSKKK